MALLVLLPQNPRGKPWMPGLGEGTSDDRVSATLIHGGMHADPRGNIPLYSFDLGGVILSNRANKLLCAFAYDVGTIWRASCPYDPHNDYCIPGCTPADARGRPTAQGEYWCPNMDRSGDWDEQVDALPRFDGQFQQTHPCAFRPERLGDMMWVREGYAARDSDPPFKVWQDSKHYNELVFDADTFVRELPHAIEAFFMMAHDDCDDVHDGPKCNEYTFFAHRRFLEHFGLTRAQVPLLKLDLWLTLDSGS